MIGAVDVKEVRFSTLAMQTRFPFRYGIAGMTALPHVFVTTVLDALCRILDKPLHEVVRSNAIG